MLDTKQLKTLVVDAIEEMKGNDIHVIDVSVKSSFTDNMVIASGTSTRHVKSISENVAMKAKKAGMHPLGVEGEQMGDWVLVDLGDVVVHVMLPDVRDFYGLEKLWSVSPGDRAGSGES
ncbi:MAG TPA: ribosome silencing factor [Gammaproteobacteria bacterium]|nr:ribosome silencing factor [Gammaproteobacteria bacterium]